LARTEVTVVFSDNVAGNKEYTGLAFISSIDATAGVDDFVTYSCTLEGNGTLTAQDVPA
jgi:predicted secreted protein